MSLFFQNIEIRPVCFLCERLSNVPVAEVCGWCKDKYGLSWQIMPEIMDELMKRPGAFAKMMQMSKIMMDAF